MNLRDKIYPNVHALDFARGTFLLAALNAAPDDASETWLPVVLEGVKITASPAEIRAELNYLSSRGLIDLNRDEKYGWSFCLTREGRDVMDRTIPVEKGIYLPPLPSLG